MYTLLCWVVSTSFNYQGVFKHGLHLGRWSKWLVCCWGSLNHQFELIHAKCKHPQLGKTWTKGLGCRISLNSAWCRLFSSVASMLGTAGQGSLEEIIPSTVSHVSQNWGGLGWQKGTLLNITYFLAVWWDSVAATASAMSFTMAITCMWGWLDNSCGQDLPSGKLT